MTKSYKTTNKLKKVLTVAAAVTTGATSSAGLVVQTVEATNNVNVLKQENKNAGIPGKKTELKEKMDEANTEVIAKSTALRGAEENRDKAQKAYDDSKSEVKQYKDKVDSIINGEVSKRKEALEVAKTNIEKLNKEKSAIEDEIAKDNEQIKELESKIEEVTSGIENGTSALEETNDDSQTTLEELKAKKTNLENDIESLVNQKKANENALEEAKAVLSNLEKEKNTLEGIIEALEKRQVSLKKAINSEYTEGDKARLQSEIDKLQEEIEELNGQSEQVSATDGTSFIDKITQAQSAYSEALENEAKAKEELDNAKTKYDEALAKKNAIDDGTDETLSQKNKELDELYSKLEKKHVVLSEKYNILRPAYIAYNEISTKYNNNIESFLKYVQENSTDTSVQVDIKKALNLLNEYDGKKVPIDNYDVKYYDSENYENSPLDLQNFLESLQYIEISNAIRKKENKPELKVSYYLMIAAALQNVISSIIQNHSRLIVRSENLFLTDYDTNPQIFYKKDGTVNVDRIEAVGRETVNNITSEEDNNPFVNWWIREKVLYEQGDKNHDNIGHYINLTNSGVALTGFASYHVKNRNYENTYNQLLTEEIEYSPQGNGEKKYITGSNVSEVKELVNKWKSYKNSKEIQSKINSAKQALDIAEEKYNIAYEEAAQVSNSIKSKESEIATYKSEIETQFSQEEANHNTAQQKYESSQNISTQKQKETELLNKQLALSDIDKSSEQLDEENTQVNDILSDKKSAKSQADESITSQNKTIDDLNTAIKDAPKEISKKQEELKGLISEVIEKLNNVLGTTNANLEKATQGENSLEATYNLATNAKTRWINIQNNKESNYGTFNDATLDSANNFVESYISKKEKSNSLLEKLSKEEKAYQTANADYQTAVTNYNKAKKAYNSFDKTHGVVKTSTISLYSEVKYTGKPLKPKVTVKNSLGKVISSKEYTVAYSNNIKLGKATVKITMNGTNYVGTFTKTFNIVKEVKAKAIKLNVSKKVLYKGQKFTLKTYFNPDNTTYKTVSYYSSNKKVATVSKNGTVKALKSGAVNIVAKTKNGKRATCKVTVKNNISLSKVTIPAVTVAYTGKSVKPVLNAKYGTSPLKENVDYTISFVKGKNSKNIGTAYAIVKGKGKFAGTKTIKYRIVPQKVTQYTPTSDENKIVVKFKKVAQATGYQIAYQEKGASTWNYVTVTAKYTTKEINNLASGQYYYVKVRAYKTVGNTKYYGNYSNVKTVKSK